MYVQSLVARNGLHVALFYLASRVCFCAYWSNFGSLCETMSGRRTYGQELVSVGIRTKWWKHPTTAINLPMTAPFPPDLGSSRVRCDIITSRALEPKPNSTRIRYRSIRSHDGEKRQHTAVFGASTRSHFYQRLVRRWYTYHRLNAAHMMTFTCPCLTTVDAWFDHTMIDSMPPHLAASGTTIVSSASTLFHTEWVGKWHD